MIFKLLLALTVVQFGLAAPAHGADWENQPPWAASPPWPDKIELESPDPVLGKSEIYETWAYTDVFAKRFSNLPIEQARKDMPPGLQAVVFRIYRSTSGIPGITRSPLYWCAMDAYMDATIAPEDRAIPEDRMSQVEDMQSVISLRRLYPIHAVDVQSKSTAIAFRYGRFLHYNPVTFLDGVLDSRYSLLGAVYRPNALPGLHLLTISTTAFCPMVWTARPGQRYILSVLGNDPYQEIQIREAAKQKGIAAWGDETDKHMLGLLRSGAEYNWTPEDTAKGLFALPDDFVQRMLKKALAAKTFNRCIEMERNIALQRYPKMPVAEQGGIQAGCRSLRETGQVYDAYDRKFGFSDSGEMRTWKLEGINKP